MSIFDGLMNPAAVGGAFAQGLATGKAEREEREVKGALSAYAVNPDDETAFRTLAQYKPELAISIGQDRRKREQAARQAELQRMAAGGDKSAIAELWGIDPQVANTISDDQRAEVGERANVIGQAALRISQLPPEQRPQAWDQAVGQLSSRYPELADYQGKYSEQALASAIDQAKLVGEFFNLERPSYMAVGGEEDLVNTRDPAAVAAVIARRAGGAPVTATTKEAYDALPPGASYVAPDGTTRTKGGGAGNGAGSFPR